MNAEQESTHHEYDCGRRDCSKTWSGDDLATIAKRVARHYNEEHNDSLKHGYEQIDTVERGGHHVHGNEYCIKRIPIYVTSFDVMDRIGCEDGMAVPPESADVCTDCHTIIKDTSDAVDTSENDYGDSEWRCRSCADQRTIDQKQEQNQQLDAYADGGTDGDYDE